MLCLIAGPCDSELPSMINCGEGACSLPLDAGKAIGTFFMLDKVKQALCLCCKEEAAPHGEVVGAVEETHQRV